MPTFSTPAPVALRVRQRGGRVTVAAEERDDTTVDVRPADPTSDADVDHARSTVVEQRGTEVVVLAPEATKRFGRGPSTDVTVRLPAGSTASITVSSADVRLTGRVADLDITTSSGDVDVEHAGDLSITVASGDVTCRRTDGDARVRTASGSVRFEEVVGDVSVVSASGDVAGQRALGNVEIRTASGDAAVDVVGGSASARTASGDVRLGAVSRGTVEVDSASGDIAVGVAAGSAAWLDVSSLSGAVASSLDESGPPEEGTDVVSIHARTISGNITISRASATS